MIIELILKRFFNVVAKDLKHANYTRTITKADKYKRFVTGEGLDDLLRQYVKRESEELFKQRKQLTRHIVKSVCGNLLDVFYKVPRSNAARRVLGYTGDESNTRSAELNGILTKFWGTQSFDDYMATRFIELNSIDPNAFVVLEFKDFNNELELVSPYPFEVYSDAAIDYKYENNVLQYLIVRTTVKIPKGKINNEAIIDRDDEYANGFKFTLYGPNQTYMLTEVSTNETQGVTFIKEGERYKTSENATYVKLGQKFYRYEEAIPHNLNAVPAFRVGYVRDLHTNGDTCLFPLDKAEPYLDKTIKTNSELDLVATLLAFPQMVKYGSKCDDTNCYNGYYNDNTPCKSCGGTGIKATAPSAQDAIVLPMPESKEQLIPLSEIITYVHPPVEAVEWQDKYIDKLTAKCKQAMFNSDIFSRQEIAETATGKNIDMNNVYDTLYSFAQYYGRVWEFCVKSMAKLADRDKNLVVSYTFGKDFKLKSLDGLVVDLKTANDSGADDSLIRHINDDIALIIFGERPVDLKKYYTKTAFNPFSGKSEKEVLLLLSSQNVPKRYKVLYSNYGVIFDELELEYAGNGKNFYELKRSEQQKAIDAKVDKLLEQVEAETPKPVSPFVGGK